MMTERQGVVACIVALAVLGGTGCVTKGKFREHSAAVDTRISGVEGAVEANERRVADMRVETDRKIGDVDQRAGQAQEKAEEAEKLARGKILWTVTLTDDNVKFAHDMANVTPAAATVLDDLASKVKAYGKTVYLEIEGHTDSTGPDQYNIVLGERRAAAIRNYLTQKAGLPLHAMNTISYGETEPIADNSSREGRSQNRRVVIKVLE